MEIKKQSVEINFTEVSGHKYYKNSDGFYHREDGPAIEFKNGDKHWYINGKRHRENGPACEYANGDRIYYKNGNLHREDGPTCEYAIGGKSWYLNGIGLTESDFNLTMSAKQKPVVDRSGNKRWYNDSKKQLHREDGPAIEYANGNRLWYKNDKRHREDGPAIEYANGDKHWHIDGKRHREDGPAIEYADSEKHWFINDKLHRVDGPAIIYSDGSKLWYLDDVNFSEKEFNIKIKNMATKKTTTKAKPKAKARVNPTTNSFGTIIYTNSKGQYHRLDSPAIIWADGRQEWYKNGNLHNDKGPALVESGGTKYYYLNGKGCTKEQIVKILENPTEVNAAGTKIWKNTNGQFHRENGPAIEYVDGTKSWHINGQLHREDGAAYIYGTGGGSLYYLNGVNYTEAIFKSKIALFPKTDSSGNKQWYNKEGQLHRVDGPAIEYINGDKHWYINGKYHREDGPAIEANGDKFWYKNGLLDREGGPALEYSNGTKTWYKNGKLHREDGPAYEPVNGAKEWYFDNCSLTEAEFNLKIKNKNNKMTNTNQVVDRSGNKRWYNDSKKLHREDGPAYESKDCKDQGWYKNGKRHREDGPAIESYGYKEYFLEGREYSKPDYDKRILQLKKDGSLMEKKSVSGVSRVKRMAAVVKSDSGHTAYRVAAAQMAKAAKAAIVQMLSSQGQTAGNVAAISAFLDTAPGEALVSYVMGVGLQMIPSFGNENTTRRAEKLAEEFRVSAMTSAANMGISMVVGQFLPMVQGVLSSLPDDSENPVVNLLKPKKKERKRVATPTPKARVKPVDPEEDEEEEDEELEADGKGLARSA